MGQVSTEEDIEDRRTSDNFGQEPYVPLNLSKAGNWEQHLEEFILLTQEQERQEKASERASREEALKSAKNRLAALLAVMSTKPSPWSARRRAIAIRREARPSPRFCR